MTESPLRVEGRVALITGSGHLVRVSVAKATAKEITAAGGKAIVHIGNVADRNVANAVVKTAVDNFGCIDIVINNAGHDMLDVHVGGAWNVTQEAWPYMKGQNYGRVVMIASPVILGAVQQSSYGAAKMAVMELARSIAIEGKQHNILVNTMVPMAATLGNTKKMEDGQLRSLMEAYMPARDIAPTVTWLGHETSQVNGETVMAINRLITWVFLAETKGFFGPAEGEWTPESVRDNWHKVVDEKECNALAFIDSNTGLSR
ncbi:short-chain dehydrogenase reductase sdr [Fusarium heterosporum]|uniref:Short-chain dehydrogenase reductase sdr n=1 Tax=Fusarium heterosporum TaxID=42747 RepID=A0A8H5TZK6_FUSHE|nr:short-chain dehydrogenase reductase sdr [Fusarium heterosporum]